MAKLSHASNLSAAMKILQEYEKETNSSFATTSQNNYCNDGDFGQPPNAEELRRQKVMFEELPLEGVPHVMLGVKKFSLQHGPKRKSELKKLKMEDKSAHTKKSGCDATITLHSVWVFPESKITTDTLWHRQETCKKIQSELEEIELRGEHRVYVSLPDPQTHSNHLDEQAQEWKSWKEDIKERKKKKREKRLIKLAEQQNQMEEEEGEAHQEQNGKDQGRSWTVSIALPGSILDNAQSPELRTYLAGQIARALVIFNVDEIIIFDESGDSARADTAGAFSGIGKKGNANVQLARILQYLECPQYLRKSFFPKHSDLQYAGLLNPLDCPHHVRATEHVPYREGVVVDRPVAKGRGSLVNVGLLKEVEIDRRLQAGLRVTVEMQQTTAGSSGGRVACRVVSPTAPRIEAGLYWGYTVRLAPSLGAVFTGCPFSDGSYDLTVGTCETGSDVNHTDLPHFKHALIVFGGVQGLGYSLEVDPDLMVSDPSLLFDHYVNVCPDQGSRTIRTEEALLIAMTALRPRLQSARAVNGHLGS